MKTLHWIKDRAPKNLLYIMLVVEALATNMPLLTNKQLAKILGITPHRLM